MRKLLVVLAVLLAAALSVVGITSTHAKAGVFAPGTPGPPAGYHQTYAHNFTTQGQGDWVTQPNPGAHVLLSKSFGLGVEMTSINQWAEIISSKVVITPNTFVKALVYIPSASGKDGMGRSYGPGATANWPAWWTAGNPWPENGEIDALEGIAGHSSFHGFYGPSVAGKISSPNFNATPNSIGTGWFTLSFLRSNGKVTAWYGTHKLGTFNFPTNNANETLRFQNQSYATSVCASCFGPTLLGAKSTAWLSRVTVWSLPKASPVPTPTPTKTTPAPTPTPTPPPTTTGFSCVKQDNPSRNDGDFAGCPGPGLSGGSNQSDVVTQDIWNKTGAFSRQDLSSNGAGDWQIAANMASGNTAVESYPDTQDTVTLPTDKPAPISGYTSVKSTYSTTLPASPGATDDYEAAYDIWLSDSTVQAWTNQKELMIWTDTLRQRPAGNDTGQTWTDASTGKVYEIWANSGTISLVARTNAGSGSVDLLALYKFLEAHTFNGFAMPANAGVDQVGYGFEVCSTSGQTETFKVNGYTLNATGSGI